MNPEGFNVSKEWLTNFALRRIRERKDLCFQYDRVVFTVGLDEPYLHIYARNSGMGLLTASYHFMQEVWPRVPHEFLLALIRQPRVATLAQRFGWKEIGLHPSGARVFKAERPDHELC